MIGRMLAYEHHRGSAMLVQYLDGLRPIASACGWLRAHWSIEPFIQRARGVGVEAGHAGEFGAANAEIGFKDVGVSQLVASASSWSARNAASRVSGRRAMPARDSSSAARSLG